jgi:hypothetical protein
MIEREQWIWFGFPKHFIMADKCQFHMATKVGHWIISTVGQLVTDDMDEYNYDIKENPDGIKMKEVGAGRFFETMVFEAEKARCDCCEWEVNVENGRHDFPGGAYDTASEAREGHMKVCEFIAKNQ